MLSITAGPKSMKNVNHFLYPLGLLCLQNLPSMYKLLSTLALVILLCGIACKKDNNESLEDTTWRLKELVGNLPATVPTDVVITATFKDGALTGSGSRNTYSSTYTTTGDQISVMAFFSTLIATNTWETRYFKALKGSETRKISGKTLTIEGTGESLVFKKQ